MAEANQRADGEAGRLRVAGTAWEVLRFASLIVFAAALLVCASLFRDSAARSPYPWGNHDVSFLTWAGVELQRGARLYVDFREMNPPGSHFLHATLAGLADRTGAPDLLVVHLFVLGLALVGGVLIAVTYWSPADAPVSTLVVLAYTLVAVRGNFANNVIPSAPWIPYDFAQREHMFVLLFAPYALWRLAGRPARWPVVPYLVLLGFVTVWKPYWLPLVLAVELYARWRHGRFERRVAVALIAGGLLPYAWLALHSLRSFRAFVGEVVPEMLAGGYAPRYGFAAAEFFASPLHAQMLGAGAAFGVCAVLAARTGRAERSVVRLLAALVMLGYAILVFQGKYWSYHGMIFFGVVVTAGAFLLARLLDPPEGASPRQRAWSLGVCLVLAPVLVAAVAGSVKSLATMLERYPPKGHELLAPLRAERGARMMFFSTGADYAYAPLMLDLETVGPWREHYRLAALLALDDPERRAAALDDYARAVERRIEEARPDLLLFSPLGVGLPVGVHIHDVLRDHGALPREGYVRLSSAGWAALDPRLAGWIVYRRSDGA